MVGRCLAAPFLSGTRLRCFFFMENFLSGGGFQKIRPLLGGAGIRGPPPRREFFRTGFLSEGGPQSLIMKPGS